MVEEGGRGMEMEEEELSRKGQGSSCACTHTHTHTHTHTRRVHTWYFLATFWSLCECCLSACLAVLRVFAKERERQRVCVCV